MASWMFVKLLSRGGGYFDGWDMFRRDEVQSTASTGYMLAPVIEKYILAFLQ
jgi:hypothetical protein